MNRRSPDQFRGIFHGRMARLIVILFLAYAGFDLANPQFCAEEFLPSAVALAASVEKSNVVPTTNSIQFSEGTEQEDAPSMPHSDEDCFCCCAHVLPGITTHPNGASDAGIKNRTFPPDRITSAHLNTLYHPPRVV